MRTTGTVALVATLLLAAQAKAATDGRSSIQLWPPKSADSRAASPTEAANVEAEIKTE
jgi:hypothetical protein